MEDVVLHYRPGPAGLSALIKNTEKLLKPFACRPPPVFTPWFPATAQRHPPLRPARPPPVISTDWGRPRTSPALKTPDDPTQKDGVSETLSGPCQKAGGGAAGPWHPLPGASPLKRSWSVLAQSVPQASAPSLSRDFHHTVSVHKLHLRQRARWVVRELNCGATQDIEQAWRAVSQAVQSSRLPTCNANIQRERGEIWVFCDILHAEQVGVFLKRQLRLSGTIGLTVHRLGCVFTM